MNSPTNKNNNNKQKEQHVKTRMVGDDRCQSKRSSTEPRSHCFTVIARRLKQWGQTRRSEWPGMGVSRLQPERGRAPHWVVWLVTAAVATTACGDRTQSSQLTDEQQVLALTLLAEARGEGVQGMEAVAMVIKQRMTNRSQTAKQVCLAPKQFSAWNGRSRAELEYLWRSPAAPEAIGVVRRFDELDPSVIDYADHYCTVQITPYWALDQQPVAVIGNHKFFRLRY